jgi:hypothetical protein
MECLCISFKKNAWKIVYKDALGASIMLKSPLRVPLQEFLSPMRKYVNPVGKELN